MGSALLDGLADKYLAMEHKSFQANDLLLVKFSSQIAVQEAAACVKMLREFLDADGFSNVKVLAVPDHLDLKHLSEFDMNELGWYRRDSHRGYDLL